MIKTLPIKRYMELFSISKDNAKKLKAILCDKIYNNSTDNAMHKINSIIGKTAIIKSIKGSLPPAIYWSSVVALYAEQKFDTDITVIYDTVKSKYYIDSYRNYILKNHEKYKINMLVYLPDTVLKKEFLDKEYDFT